MGMQLDKWVNFWVEKDCDFFPVDFQSSSFFVVNSNCVCFSVHNRAINLATEQKGEWKWTWKIVVYNSSTSQSTHEWSTTWFTESHCCNWVCLLKNYRIHAMKLNKLTNEIQCESDRTDPSSKFQYPSVNTKRSGSPSSRSVLS